MSESGVCARIFAYKAVCVLWSVAATCTLPMTAVADVGTEAPAVALLSTHRLRHCQETDAGRRQRTCDIHLRSAQRASRIHLRLSGHEQRQNSDVSLREVKSRPLKPIHVLGLGGSSSISVSLQLSSVMVPKLHLTETRRLPSHSAFTATAPSVRPLSRTGCHMPAPACILTNATFTV